MPLVPVRIVATVTFHNRLGDLANPTAVVFLTELGSTVTTYTFGVDPEVTNPSLGTFQLELIQTDPGRLGIRAEGSGAVVATDEVAVVTSAPRVA